MICLHEKVIVTPGLIEKNGDDFVIEIQGGTMNCRECHDELPFEDLALYAEQNVTVGIPTELVDD